MAKKKKVNKKTEYELLENPDAIAGEFSKVEHFLEKNKNLVFGILGAIALVVAGVLYYNHYNKTQNADAQNEMFQAQYWFEADSLDLALNGDGNDFGFLEIIETYGSTKAANLAHFYTGVSYLKKGEFDNAIEHLQDFSADDFLIQARAYALIGDAYMEKGEYSEAVSNYAKAASYEENESFSPMYLLKEALAQEKLSDFAGAAKSYDKIINDFPKSGEFQEANKRKARIENKTSE